MHSIPETLLKLVEIYSPSGQEAGAVNWLVTHMQSLGFINAFVDEAGNAVGTMGEGEHQIVLLGHIDTVPGEIPVRIEDGVLHGRGAVDAKGPLASFVDAAAAVGTIPGIQIIVIGAVDEERDSTGARFIVDQYQPDFAIIGEPSQWNRVTLGYKGTAWAEITVRRSIEHTAGRGESAPEAAVSIWNALLRWVGEFNSDRNRVFDQVLPTLRGFSSDEDGFEGRASLRIGVRLPEDLNPPEWYEILRAVASAAGGEVTPHGFHISAYRAEKNSHLVRAFLRGIRYEGGKPGFVIKTGTADLNIVAPIWGCQAVAYGPGDSSLDHTPLEHLHLEEYHQAVGVLKNVLRDLAANLTKPMKSFN